MDIKPILLEGNVLKIKQVFVNEMIAHALEDDPNECCGILAGNSNEIMKLYRMTNVAHSPYRYDMDPKELYNTYMEIDDGGWDIMVIYYSHTHTPAYPSDTDIRLATWPDAFYVLISLMDKSAPPVNAFKIVDGVVSEEAFEVL